MEELCLYTREITTIQNQMMVTYRGDHDKGKHEQKVSPTSHLC